MGLKTVIGSSMRLGATPEASTDELVVVVWKV